jgi:hypothetical protein
LCSAGNITLITEINEEKEIDLPEENYVSTQRIGK